MSRFHHKSSSSEPLLSPSDEDVSPTPLQHRPHPVSRRRMPFVTSRPSPSNSIFNRMLRSSLTWLGALCHLLQMAPTTTRPLQRGNLIRLPEFASTRASTLSLTTSRALSRVDPSSQIHAQWKQSSRQSQTQTQLTTAKGSSLTLSQPSPSSRPERSRIISMTRLSLSSTRR